MSAVQVGDIVDVVRRDVTVTRSEYGSGGNMVEGRQTQGRTIAWDRRQVEFVNVRHAQPEHWPPQAGDVWRTETGVEWHVVTAVYPKGLEARSAGGEFIPVASFPDVLKGRNPKLAYRQGNTSG